MRPEHWVGALSFVVCGPNLDFASPVFGPTSGGNSPYFGEEFLSPHSKFL